MGDCEFSILFDFVPLGEGNKDNDASRMYNIIIHNTISEVYPAAIATAASFDD